MATATNFDQKAFSEKYKSRFLQGKMYEGHLPGGLIALVVLDDFPQEFATLLLSQDLFADRVAGGFL